MIIGISGKIGSGKDTIYKIINYLINKKRDNKIADYESCLKHDSNFLSEPFENKKFADKLKDLVCLLINCTREDLENQEFKNKSLGKDWIVYQDSTKLLRTQEERDKYFGKEGYDYITNSTKIELTPRLLLQLIGTECGRDIIHPNIWINSLFSNYKTSKNSSYEKQSNWIITDLRFPNEVESIRLRGGILIRVNRRRYKYLNKNLFVQDVSLEERDKYLIELDPSGEHESETALDNYKDFNYIINNNSSIEVLIKAVEKILKNENLI